jgi:hypothetical protein
VIIAIVRFSLDAAMSADAVRASFEASAPSYQGLPGLLRKHYLLGEDATVGGGVYLWETKAAAEAVYNEAWRERLTKRFGAPPTVEYFESPVTVDPDSIIVGTA